VKYEQWNNPGHFGMTAFGVADYETTIAAPINTNTQVIFTSNDIQTDLYLSSLFQTSFAAGRALRRRRWTGMVPQNT
jgi:hypothetical protein